MGSLEGLYDGDLENLHRWEEVNIMQMCIVFLQLEKDGRYQMTILNIRMKIN